MNLLIQPLAKRLRRVLWAGSCVVCAATLMLSQPASAQIGDLRLPISLDADSTDYDGKTSMLMFEGLRLSQGNIGVQADRGLASKLDFEDSVWQFTGNVIIDTENGRIECDSADLRFTGHQLTFASLEGTPATFEMRRAESEETTYAQAGRLDYDFSAGIVEFTDDAVISEGGNRIASHYLVYNIAEQRINAQSAGEGEPRVKITYTPRPGAIPESDGDDAPSGEPPGEAGGEREDGEDSAQPAGPPQAEPGAGGT